MKRLRVWTVLGLALAAAACGGGTPEETQTGTETDEGLAPESVGVAGGCSRVVTAGKIIGHPTVCGLSSSSRALILVAGDFGSEPLLEITGPSGYDLPVSLKRLGKSCVYHYRWDTIGNGGPGTYTFAVSGKGNAFSFTQALSCPRHR